MELLAFTACCPEHSGRVDFAILVPILYEESLDLAEPIARMLGIACHLDDDHQAALPVGRCIGFGPNSNHLALLDEASP